MLAKSTIASLLAAFFCIGGCSSMKQDTPRAQTPAQGALDTAQLARSHDQNIPSTNNFQVVSLFNGPMPTGVTVSKNGRIFVNFPRWGDPVEFTVGELRDGKAVPYPNLATNRLQTDNQAESLVSVQSVVVDPLDRLWIVDTGSINFQPNKPGGPKLLCYDLKTDRLVQRINFDDKVVLPTSYLNDIRFNMTMGKAGVAFITDSSDSGPNGIVVVDLASGLSWRKLHDHPSTKADQNFVPTVEGRPLLSRPADGAEANIRIGADGIAISPDGKTLYYCPLASRRLYSVSTEALADGKLSEEETARTVQELPKRDFASDGLECDAQGNLLLTDYEHNAIRRFNAGAPGDSAGYETIAQDPRLIWPDTLSMTDDGWLYVTANQLNRQAAYHKGVDQRKQPYVLFRTQLGQRRLAVALSD